MFLKLLKISFKEATEDDRSVFGMMLFQISFFPINFYHRHSLGKNTLTRANEEFLTCKYHI